nr:hypothetical protein [uncultured Desulfobulbus sp.]
MKLSLLPNRIFALLLLVLLLAGPDMLCAATPEEQQTTPVQDSLPKVQQPAAKQDNESAELEALHQQYHKKDPTGVRARLGMCRRDHPRGHGRMGLGKGKGYGRRHGGQLGPHHRWQQGDEAWETQQ